MPDLALNIACCLFPVARFLSVVPVMQILAVFVIVRHRIMLVHVAMRAGGHRVVPVRVVAVVVRVHVLVAEGVVVVPVVVVLGGVEPDACGSRAAWTDTPDAFAASRSFDENSMSEIM